MYVERNPLHDEKYPVRIYSSFWELEIPERFQRRIYEIITPRFRRRFSDQDLSIRDIASTLQTKCLDASERNSVNYLEEIDKWCTGLIELVHGKYWHIIDLVEEVSKWWSGSKQTQEWYSSVFHTGSELFRWKKASAMSCFLIEEIGWETTLSREKLIQAQKAQKDWIPNIHQFL